MCDELNIEEPKNQQYYFIEKGLRFAIWEIIKEQKKNPCSEINIEECFRLYIEYNKIL